jgi:hypothetical protein
MPRLDRQPAIAFDAYPELVEFLGDGRQVLVENLPSGVLDRTFRRIHGPRADGDR